MDWVQVKWIINHEIRNCQIFLLNLFVKNLEKTVFQNENEVLPLFCCFNQLYPYSIVPMFLVVAEFCFKLFLHAVKEFSEFKKTSEPLFWLIIQSISQLCSSEIDYWMNRSKMMTWIHNPFELKFYRSHLYSSNFQWLNWCFSKL